MEKHWTISSGETVHNIVYQGNKWSGNIKMMIDGEYSEYIPTVVKKVGVLAKLDIPGQNVILHISLNGKDADLAVDGVYVDSQASVDERINLDMSSGRANGSPVLQNKIKSGFGSFLTFIALTYINLLLIIMNTSFNFPFSATVPQLLLVFGELIYEQEGLFLAYVIGAALAIIATSVYLLLFFLSKKRIAPLYITLVLIIIDTLLLIFLSLGDIASGMIDVAFHIWVIWSIVNLLKSKRALSRAVEDEFMENNGAGIL